MYTGKQIFMETLVAENVEYVFGNPGTTELPLLDALLDYPQVRYIMTLHEAVAVSMADAYAHASGHVAVVNLHVAPGLGNGLGSVYNAWEGQTPMVITAGQQNSKLRLREPILGHDLVARLQGLFSRVGRNEHVRGPRLERQSMGNTLPREKPLQPGHHVGDAGRSSEIWHLCVPMGH